MDLFIYVCLSTTRVAVRAEEAGQAQAAESLHSTVDRVGLLDARAAVLARIGHARVFCKGEMCAVLQKV